MLGKRSTRKRRQNRSPSRRCHVRKVEGDMPRRLSGWGIDQSQALIVAQQSDGDAGFAQQSLEAAMPGRTPSVFVVGRFIEIGVRVFSPNEHRPLRFRGTHGRYCPSGRQHDPHLGDGHHKIIVLRGSSKIFRVPAQPVEQDPLDIGGTVFHRRSGSVRLKEVDELSLPAHKVAVEGITWALAMTVGATTRPTGWTNPIHSWWARIMFSCTRSAITTPSAARDTPIRWDRCDARGSCMNR